MAIEYGKCVFRIVGCLSPGYFEVEYVRAGEGPVVVRPEDAAAEVRRWDEVWIRELPIALVPPECRLPNTLIEVTARARREVVSVSPACGKIDV